MVTTTKDQTEITAALERGPVLVLCGPSERRRLQRLSTVSALTLAEGPRENALLEIRARSAQEADAKAPPG